MFVTINHTCRAYATHSTRKQALQAALACITSGCFATVWTLANATKYGQLVGLENVTSEARCQESL